MIFETSWLNLVACFSCCLCIILLIFGCKRDHRNIKGPKGWPIIGILLQIGDLGGFHKKLTNIGHKYGRIFGFNLMGSKVIVLRSASMANMALGKGGLTDRTTYFFQKYVFNGHDFAFANYNQHVPELRNVFHRAMYVNWKERETIDPGLDTEVDRLIGNVNAEQGKAFNPDKIIKRLMTNLFTRQLIGEALPEDDVDQDALWELIDLLYTLIDPSIDRPLKMFPFLRHLPGKHGRIFRASIKARDRVSKRYFDTSKATFQEGRVRGLVDVCLQMQADDIREKGECWLTDDYIKGIMYDTVVAGMTEMMKSLRMLILLVCHHQDVQSRVQQEIHDVIREDKPTCSHRKEMPYTQAVIYEMLRYVSQTPLAIPHKCNKDIILDGYLIEKNSGIVPNIWGIHHDDDVWGDSWVFRPERFLDENKQLIPSDHKLMKSFIPFSVGKRRCPGENFAMSRTFLVFVSLLQQLHFAPPEDQELPSVDPRLYTNKYPLHLPVFSCTATSRPEGKTT